MPEIMNEVLKDKVLEEIDSVNTIHELLILKSKYLGKKGILTLQIKSLSSFEQDKKKIVGKEINEVKQFIEAICEEKENSIKNQELEKKLFLESIDITLPGKFIPKGNLHPINKVLNEIIEIFTKMGFGVEEGPEVELDKYNFEYLNIPKDHPARDMQDTFYINENVVLRTHTSPVQIRVMERQNPPLRFIAPGKVYRCDTDISHTQMFHQVEGLMVDEDVSFSNLKAILESFIHQMFGVIPVRFRPSFFPFTEPSAEVDMGCIFCQGKGCGVCKGSGWIEVLGAGMVNPKIFEYVNYDTEQYKGFAFGMGIERIAMLKYNINDIRMFFENDIRFLRQF